VRDPWGEIASSAHPSVDNVRRYEATHPLDFKRGRDFLGRYLLILEGGNLPSPWPEVPSLEGVEISLIEDGPGFRLIITLLSHPDLELFRALCSDLIAATSILRHEESVKGLVLVLQRIRRWQDLLRRGHGEVLSYSEVIGLTGELLFLRDQLLGKLSAKTAIASWRGAYEEEQDFVISQTIFEVKTQLATSDARLQISSENQLDTSSGEIILVHQTMSVDVGSSRLSRTLNGLVEEILAQLENEPEATDLFNAALISARYVRRAEYNHPTWLLTSKRFFQVGAGFPRLTPASLPAGVDRVRYLIKIDSCMPFSVGERETMERVLRVRT
jgi:hypothetical protein